jgi:hypothetical protein
VCASGRPAANPIVSMVLSLLEFFALVRPGSG